MDSFHNATVIMSCVSEYDKQHSIHHSVEFRLLTTTSSTRTSGGRWTSVQLRSDRLELGDIVREVCGVHMCVCECVCVCARNEVVPVWMNLTRYLFDQSLIHRLARPGSGPS